jgi:RHS repeat-associated protein
VKLNYDSGTAGTYAGFDRFDRVVDQLWYDYGASADRDRFTYGYDRASSRLYRENTVASAKDEYYTYDDVNRLATFDRGDLDAGKTAISGTPVKEEDWALDMTGNWTDFLQKTSGTTDLNQDRAHNPVNEITGITETVGTAWVDPVHDQAGNMTTMPKPSSLNTALTCTWDAWNRLVEVKQGAVVMGHYEYDALGRRVKSHVDSQSPGSPNGVDAYVHYFYNSGWQELESRVSASENTGPESLQPTYQYVWSRRYIDAPVLRDKNTDADGLCDDERIYYLGDANFNITTLVNTGGDAVERYVYTPYGVLTVYDATWANIRSTSSYANAYTYTGRQLDAETGLYYYRARLYAPQLGRFASRDPFRDAQETSLVAYVRGAPMQVVDPTGLHGVASSTLELIGEEKDTSCAVETTEGIDEGCLVTDVGPNLRKYGFKFARRYTFSGNCRCCSFRQYLLQRTVEVSVFVGGSFVRVPGISGSWSFTGEAKEDRAVRPPNMGRAYGHREDDPMPGDEYTAPDQKTGCKYQMGDHPGFYVEEVQEGIVKELGDAWLALDNRIFAISFTYRFLLNIENTCQGVVLQSTVHVVSCPLRSFAYKQPPAGSTGRVGTGM